MTQPTVVPWGQCTETADSYVRIEERSEGYVRYQNQDGRRWIVEGVCDRRGDCLIGMTIEGYGVIENHADIEEAKQLLGVERIDSYIDVPVTPDFDSCCGDPVTGTFSYVELEPVQQEG